MAILQQSNIGQKTQELTFKQRELLFELHTEKLQSPYVPLAQEYGLKKIDVTHSPMKIGSATASKEISFSLFGFKESDGRKFENVANDLAKTVQVQLDDVYGQKNGAKATLLRTKDGKAGAFHAGNKELVVSFKCSDIPLGQEGFRKQENYFMKKSEPTNV